MRAFIAIELPDGVRDALVAVMAPAGAAHPELSWTPPERWHVTTTFLADLPAEHVAALVERLERAAARTPSFALSLEGVGRFGQRVLYARLAGDRDALRRLADRTTAAARRCGVDVPDAAYRPHVTLARARRPTDLRPVACELGGLALAPWRVERVVLVRSTLGAEPHHEVIAAVPLA